MAEPAPPSAIDRPELSDELRDVLWWHGAWGAAAILALIVMALTVRGLSWSAAAAMIAGAAPGFAGLLLRRHDSPRFRALLLALWGGCGGLACMLAGGLAGPLAVWCLAPAAAAAVFGASTLLAEAAALALVAAAGSALVGLAGFVPAAPPPGVAFWLGFTGVVTTGLGFGAGLLASRRRASARESLRKAGEAALQRLLSEQPYLTLALTPDGRVEQALGRPPEGMAVPEPGSHLLDQADPADHDGLEDALILARRIGRAEYAFAPFAAPGRTAVLAIRLGSDERLVGVLRDATAERMREASLESAREQAEALNAGKSRFLANMSHELRTPLNAIMGFSDVMRAGLFGPLQPKYADYVGLIYESGQHLLDLINDVLDISKIEADRYELSRETFDAREAVSSALRLTRLQADAAGVSQRGLLPPGPLEVDADRRAIKQMVLNLVSNAVKFTPRSGSVTVTANGYGEDLEIVVSDTGVGIAAADLERLGRPYEQAGDPAQKIRGTGLGLSLVRALAELHGGSMSIESRLGEGTSVTVRMPVLRPPRSNGAQPSQSAPPPPPQRSAQIIAFNPQR
ncbi:MAG: HAMP domain-containing sensor histidine kinase [Caulobacteraceae bacterium]